MYESIRIQNFRGLKDLTIENLGRVNLLVGANNVGKTSVLEALALLHMHRDGYEVGAILESRAYRQGDSLDGALTGFFNANSAQFEIQGTHLDSTQVLLSGERTLRGLTEATDGIAHFYLNLNQREYLQLYYFRHPASGTKTGMWFAQEPIPIPLEADRSYPRPYHRNELGDVALVSAGARLNTANLADLMTERERTANTGSLAEQMRRLDSRISDLFVGFDLVGRQPTVNVKTNGDGSSDVVPFQSLGDGARRLLEILLLLPLARDGIGLLDEIEGGMYHLSLEPVWRLVNEASTDAGFQLFATTHSLECVEAAVRAFDSEHAGDFRLHRMSRRDDEIVVTTYDHEAAVATLAVGVEFR